MQCGFGFACGFAAAAAQPQSRSVLTASLKNKKRNKEKNGFVRCAAINTKALAVAALQSLSRTTLERGQKGKFFRRQKFALLHIKN